VNRSHYRHQNLAELASNHHRNGDPAELASNRHRHGDRAELASHVSFGGAAGWHHHNLGEHGCAHQTGGGDPMGSNHRPGQPASTTAGGLLHLTITL
jgi:hypothetical protein